MVTIDLLFAMATDTTAYMNAIAMFILVGVTAWYARSTHLMAKQNDRMRKERVQATLLYLQHEAEINQRLFDEHYRMALEHDKNLHECALVRFSLSGRNELPKVMGHLAKLMKDMLERYLDMERVNAHIEECFTYVVDRDHRAVREKNVAQELQRLVKENFGASLEKLSDDLNKVWQNSREVRLIGASGGVMSALPRARKP